MREIGVARLERRHEGNRGGGASTLNSRIAFLAASLSMGLNAHADVRLPRLVGDNMVLQRDTPLKMWGWADVGERVQITFRGRRVATRTGLGGRWWATLPAQHAGSPAEMRVAGKNILIVKNIVVGDVWLASGQSNMQFPMAEEGGFGGVANSEWEIAAANFPDVRLFTVKRTSALQPVEDAESTGWFPATPESVRGFSAVAYLFGRELYRRYRVPIGLIEAAWGGTPAETWVSARSLRKFPEFGESIARQSRIDVSAMAGYDTYLARRNHWYLLHGKEDRGTSAHPGWAELDYDASNWPAIIEPQPWPIKPVKEFDGTVWYRKDINVLPGEVGRSISLHLSHMLQADTTFFNGAKVGETTGEVTARDYRVPATLVKLGKNIVTVRLTGQYLSGDGYAGMLGEASQMYAEVGPRTTSLAGIWQFQPGPDLSELPEPPPLAEFRTEFPQSPTLLFNAMIAPLAPYRLKGVIWYQGESNVGRAAQYRFLFPALINDWRAHWGYQLPFLFVQLAGFGTDGPEPADCVRAELRESQSAALSLPATGMATAIDLGDSDNIHPNNKQEVAHRLALAATRVAYGEHLTDSGPTYRAMRIEPRQIRLEFYNKDAALRVSGEPGEPRGFAIAGTDNHFVWARARIEGRTVVVWSDAVALPNAVRYDWGNTPDGNLYNDSGLPALPFRTSQ
jgi:sialate O-acetylesterase